MTNTTLEILGANVYKVWVGDATILFSYTTPIAAWVRGNGTIRRYALKQLPSTTSARHLNKFMDLRENDEPVQKVTAEELDSIITRGVGSEPRDPQPWAE